MSDNDKPFDPDDNADLLADTVPMPGPEECHPWHTLFPMLDWRLVRSGELNTGPICWGTRGSVRLETSNANACTLTVAEREIPTPAWSNGPEDLIPYVEWALAIDDDIQSRIDEIGIIPL